MTVKEKECHKNAWKHFYPEGNGHNKIEVDPITGKTIRWVLHHVDVTLKKNNPKRYKEWRIEDLKMITEHDHISLHNTGNQAFLGRHHADISKKLIGEKNKGNKTFLGRHHSEETKRLIGEKNSQKVWTDEERQRLSNAWHASEFSKAHLDEVHKMNVGKSWWSKDGEKPKFCLSCPGEGWKQGRNIIPWNKKHK